MLSLYIVIFSVYKNARLDKGSDDDDEDDDNDDEYVRGIKQLLLLSACMLTLKSMLCIF